MAYNVKTDVYEGYIYLIFNTINNKQYVGQTRYTVEDRFKQHIKAANGLESHALLHEDMRKYGVSVFDIKPIQKVQCSSEEELIVCLNRLEIDYISYFNCLSPHGYNMSCGGGNYNRFGRKVDHYTLDGEFIKTYDTLVQAGSENQITATAVLRNCSGLVFYSPYGVFRYHGDPFDLYPVFEKNNKETVDIYDTLGNYIETIDSLNGAARKYGTDAASVCGVCNGHHSHANYYVFRYSGDAFDLYEVKSFVVGKYNKNETLVDVYLCPNQCIEREHISRQKMDGHLSGRIQLGRDGFYYRYITNIIQYKEFMSHNTKLLNEVV